MVVLDTTVLVDVENQNEAVLQEVAEHIRGEQVSITAPTVSEYWYGLLPRSEQERTRAQHGLKKYPILNTTEESAVQYAEIKYQLEQAGTPVPEFDMLIASIVQAHDETLLTADKHFEQIPQVETVLI